MKATSNRGRCHCGAITFDVEIDVTGGLFVQCNCSLCTRKNRGVAVIAAAAFQLTSGMERLAAYRWNTGREEHFFCRECGIHTHHTLADVPSRVGVNLACLDKLKGQDTLKWVAGDGAAIPISSSGN